jgi:hypothetical protein
MHVALIRVDDDKVRKVPRYLAQRVDPGVWIQGPISAAMSELFEVEVSAQANRLGVVDMLVQEGGRPHEAGST